MHLPSVIEIHNAREEVKQKQLKAEALNKLVIELVSSIKKSLNYKLQHAQKCETVSKIFCHDISTFDLYEMGWRYTHPVWTKFITELKKLGYTVNIRGAPYLKITLVLSIPKKL